MDQNQPNRIYKYIYLNSHTHHTARLELLQSEQPVDFDLEALLKLTSELHLLHLTIQHRIPLIQHSLRPVFIRSQPLQLLLDRDEFLSEGRIQRQRLQLGGMVLLVEISDEIVDRFLLRFRVCERIGDGIGRRVLGLKWSSARSGAHFGSSGHRTLRRLHICGRRRVLYEAFSLLILRFESNIERKGMAMGE